MPDSVKAMPDAEDHADNSAATAAAADDGLLATIDRNADDAHAAGADAADQNPDADDAKDKDGDAHGTARILPSKEGSTNFKYISVMTDEDKLRHRGFSDALERKFKDLPSDERGISKSKKEIAECVTEWLTEHPKGLGRGQGGIDYCEFRWSPDKHFRVCKRKPPFHVRTCFSAWVRA